MYRDRIGANDKTNNTGCWISVLDGLILAGQCVYADDLKQLLETKDCQKCELSGANFTEPSLNGLNLSGLNLTDANLKEANLEGVNLKGENLFGANLKYANLPKVNLGTAKMKRGKCGLGSVFRHHDAME